MPNVANVGPSAGSTSAHDGSESAGSRACSAAPARAASWPPWVVASSEVGKPETPTRTVGAAARLFIRPSRSDPTLRSSYGDDEIMLLKPPYHQMLATYAHGAAAGAGSVGSGAGGAPAPAGQGPSSSSLVDVQDPLARRSLWVGSVMQRVDGAQCHACGVKAIGTKGGAGTKGSAGKGGHDDSGSGARGKGDDGIGSALAHGKGRRHWDDGDGDDGSLSPM